MRIETHPGLLGEEDPSRPTPPRPDDNGNGRAGLNHALAELSKAAGARDVEGVCGAYQGVRRAARGMSVREMLDEAAGALGNSATELIVSAYSHRRCFMCSDGAVACDQCEGTGQVEEGRLCPACDGLGLMSCPFCQGTGWPDRDTVPSELREAVALHQAGSVHRDVRRLSETFAVLSRVDVRRLAPRRRREITAWLRKLEARLSRLSSDGVITDADERDRMTAAAKRIETYVETLQNRKAPRAPERSPAAS